MTFWFGCGLLFYALVGLLNLLGLLCKSGVVLDCSLLSTSDQCSRFHTATRPAAYASKLYRELRFGLHSAESLYIVPVHSSYFNTLLLSKFYIAILSCSLLTAERTQQHNSEILPCQYQCHATKQFYWFVLCTLAATGCVHVQAGCLLLSGVLHTDLSAAAAFQLGASFEICAGMCAALLE